MVWQAIARVSQIHYFECLILFAFTSFEDYDETESININKLKNEKNTFM